MSYLTDFRTEFDKQLKQKWCPNCYHLKQNKTTSKSINSSSEPEPPRKNCIGNKVSNCETLNSNNICNNSYIDTITGYVQCEWDSPIPGIPGSCSGDLHCL